MAKSIVDVLEVIEIDDQHGSGSSVPRGPFDFPSQLPLEPPPIVEAGQEIVVDEILELSRPLLALGDVLHLIDDIERAAVHIANDRDGEQHPDEVSPPVAVPLLDLVAGDSPRKEGFHLVGGETDILGVRDGVERRGLQLVGRKTRDSAQRVVDLQPAAAHVHESHADRRIAERGLEELAHLPEPLLQVQARLLGALARDVLRLSWALSAARFFSDLGREMVDWNQPQDARGGSPRLGNVDIIARVDVRSAGSRSHLVDGCRTDTDLTRTRSADTRSKSPKREPAPILATGKIVLPVDFLRAWRTTQHEAAGREPAFRVVLSTPKS